MGGKSTEQGEEGKVGVKSRAGQYPYGTQCTGAGRQWGPRSCGARSHLGKFSGAERRGAGGQWSPTLWGTT